MSSLSCSSSFSLAAANSFLRGSALLYYSRHILFYLSEHCFYFLLYFFALISFFASTWGSFGSGTLSEWVQAFFRHPTLFSFSLAAFFPCFRRFRHAFSFLPAVFCLLPLTHSSLFCTFSTSARYRCQTNFYYLQLFGLSVFFLGIFF
jgi:hypothetical protein